MPHSTRPSPAVASGVADYIIVVSNEDDYHAGFHHFADKVNRKIKAGYQLHGPPFSINQTMCQAMVRHADASSGGDTATFVKPAGHPADYRL